MDEQKSRAVPSRRADLYDWINSIIAALIVCVLVFVFLARMVNVVGSSMYPTLEENDKIIICNLFYEPQQGDIVVLRKDTFMDDPIVKRVIALEGQTVNIDFENGIVYIDNKAIDEPYVKESTFSGNYGNLTPPEVIPEGKIFVLGDNRRISLDSRSSEIGLIDVKDVIGKAQFIAFPFDHFGYLY